MRRGRNFWLLLPALLWPAPAHAHLTSTGFGPFYDGLAHPFVTPEDLLPVIALTLLAGLRGARPGRWVLFTLPAAWGVGMAAGGPASPPASAVWLTCGLTIGLGALTAADCKLPLSAIAGLAATLGLVHGGLNGAGLAHARGAAQGMAGIACAIFVIVALAAGPVASLRAAWARVAVRVAGSWIAAMGLLMLGWTVRNARL